MLTLQEAVVTQPRPEIDVFAVLPPSVKGRGLDWEWVAQQVRDNAPNWCEVGVFNPSVATHIRKGKYRWVKPEEFEIATRKIPTEERTRSRLFLRVRPK